MHKSNAIFCRTHILSFYLCVFLSYAHSHLRTWRKLQKTKAQNTHAYAYTIRLTLSLSPSSFLSLPSSPSFVIYTSFLFDHALLPSSHTHTHTHTHTRTHTVVRVLSLAAHSSLPLSSPGTIITITTTAAGEARGTYAMLAISVRVAISKKPRDF